MKKLVLLFVMLVYGVSAVYAQPSLPDKCEVFYPEILLTSVVLSEADAEALDRSSDFGQSKAPRNTTFWVVYSDRDENVTYTAPGGTTKHSTLNLNQKLRIAQIKNKYALVYTEPQEDIAYPMISQFAECKGWIPMKNLLLWHSCPADDKGIYYKALLCVNLDKEGGNIGNLYRNPKNKNKFEKLKSNMDFYFVMKREGNLSLLANTHTMEGRTDRVLYGWVSEQSYVAWNQRSCIEPTWDHKDVEYFADENIKGSIYETKNLDKCVTMIDFKRKQSQKYDKHMYRMSPDALRFPLLDDGTADLYNCSTFGASGSEPTDISNQPTEIEGGTLLGYTEKEMKEMSNINIGIVIDGTSSMEKFYPTVKEAIKEGVKFFGDGYKVRVGAVIYRDYSDGEFLTEDVSLTRPDNPNFENFLNAGGKYGIKSSKSDRTLAEAMYEGINVAIDKIGFKPDQSNLLLVVGDCGNDREDMKINRDDLVKKLVDKNISIMGFQVRNGAEVAFGDFNSQLNYLIKSSLETKYRKLSENMKVQIAETEDGYRLVNDVKSNLYVGSLSYPVFGHQEMQLNKLSKLIQESIMYCSESVKTQIDLIALATSGGFSASDIGSGMIEIEEEFVKQRLGEEVYERLKQSKQLMAFEGYTRKTHKSGRAFFKPVVFISSDELNALIERLAPVNDAAVVQTNNREPYVKAMKALIQSMVPDVSDDVMNKMGYKEVMNMVSGLNAQASALKGYTIMEIASPQAVSHTAYASLVSDFKRKFQMLQRLKAKEYTYTRPFNGLKYYWLPVEDLP
jgi:hypothetical protein